MILSLVTFCRIVITIYLSRIFNIQKHDKLKLQNHRTSEVGRDIWRPSGSRPCSSRISWNRLPWTMFGQQVCIINFSILYQINSSQKFGLKEPSSI